MLPAPNLRNMSEALSPGPLHSFMTDPSQDLTTYCSDFQRFRLVLPLFWDIYLCMVPYIPSVGLVLMNPRSRVACSPDGIIQVSLFFGGGEGVFLELYKWNDTVCTHLYLASFTHYYFVGAIHVVCSRGSFNIHCRVFY